MLASASSASASSGPPAQVRQALVIDADPVAGELYGRILKAQGFAVRIATTGVAAVRAVRALVPDVIVMDTQLPDAPGHAVVGWLRALPGAKATPVIGVSWEPLTERAHWPASHVLAKPIVPRALQQMLDRVLPAGEHKELR